MKRITKKEFKNNYGNLEICQSMIKKTKEEIAQKIKETSINVILQCCKPLKYKMPYGFLDSDIKSGRDTKVYSYSIAGLSFYIIEELIDSSKDNYTSRNDKETYTTVYKIK